MEKFDVVVVGGGYAGVMCALRLAGRSRGRISVALINERDHFVERMRLQDILSARPPSCHHSYDRLLRGRPVRFIAGLVRRLDPVGGLLELGEGDTSKLIGFRRLIYALGSRIDVQGVPGVAQHAFRLDPDGPANVYELAERLRGKPEQREILVVGGGALGIEVAAELASHLPRNAVTLANRGRTGAFQPPKVERVMRRTLKRLGVVLLDDTAIENLEEGRAFTDMAQCIPFDVCVWTGGVAAPSLAVEAGMAVDRGGRVLVDPVLRSVSHPRVLAVGDAAHPVEGTGAPYRLSAFAALTSGAHAADVILHEFAGRIPRPYGFSTFGQGIAMGPHGVGFASYPNDRQIGPVLRGRTARAVRGFFVWLVFNMLLLERSLPGGFFWLGKRRVGRDALKGYPHTADLKTID